LSKKKTKSATASVEKQMMGTLRKKCQIFEKDLIIASKQIAKLQAKNDEMRDRNEQLAATIVNWEFPEASTRASSDKGGRPATSFFDTVGSGYSEKELSRTVFNHVNAVMLKIRNLVGDDAVKALQLSDMLQQRARGQLHTQDAHDHKYMQMCTGVFESLKMFLNDLQAQYKTKAPNDIRRVMQTVVTAIMSHFDNTSQRYLVSKLELDRSWLTAGKARALSFYENV
jgi:hypothetical protein